MSNYHSNPLTSRLRDLQRVPCLPHCSRPSPKPPPQPLSPRHSSFSARRRRPAHRPSPLPPPPPVPPPRPKSSWHLKVHHQRPACRCRCPGMLRANSRRQSGPAVRPARTGMAKELFSRKRSLRADACRRSVSTCRRYCNKASC